MNDQLKRHVDDILAQMESVGTPANRTDEQEPTRIIDIHIYEMGEEQDAQSTIESTIEDVPDQPPTPPKARRRFPLVGLSLLCLVLVCALGVFYLQPLFAPSATVTIVPATRQISLESTITVVTDNAHSDQQEVPGRILPTITMSQQQSSATTGVVHQDAKAAHGTLTFYNALTTAQTIPVGELLTGADGMIVTDQVAIIPAALPPTEGQATVLAHAIQPGLGGNSVAHTIYGACCRAGILAASSAFTGGQEARTYQTVTQTDIDTIARPLTTSIEQSVQAALQKHVRSDETLITPLLCQATVKPDHQPGDAATQVSVTVDDTCQGMTYISQALRDFANTLVTEQATKQLGIGYTSGTLQTSVTHVTFKDGRASLLVHSESTWGYQFTQAEQQQIIAQIAGKTLVQAKGIVLHRAGVQSVSFSLTNGASTLPTASDHIHLLFLITGY